MCLTCVRRGGLMNLFRSWRLAVVCVLWRLVVKVGVSRLRRLIRIIRRRRLMILIGLWLRWLWVSLVCVLR